MSLALQSMCFWKSPYISFRPPYYIHPWSLHYPILVLFLDFWCNVFPPLSERIDTWRRWVYEPGQERGCRRSYFPFAADKLMTTKAFYYIACRVNLWKKELSLDSYKREQFIETENDKPISHFLFSFSFSYWCSTEIIINYFIFKFQIMM